MTGIYKIQSIIKPERIYIGSAVNLIARWTRHKNYLKRNKHQNKKLQRHYNKYGESDLFFIIIEEFDFISKEHLLGREQFYVDGLNPHFNICKKAGSRLGMRHSIQTCQKISKSLIGRKATDETKRKQSESHIGINTWSKGRIATEETRRKNSATWLGRTHTQETKEKMSESAYDVWEKRKEVNAEIKQSPEWIAKRMKSSKETRKHKKQAA